MTARGISVRKLIPGYSQGTYDRYQLDTQPQEVYPSDWVHLASQLAPKANIYDFDLFSNATCVAQEQYPVSSYSPRAVDGQIRVKQSESRESESDLRSDNLYGVKAYETRDKTDISWPTQRLRYEARRLLDEAKEPDPSSTESKWRPIIFVGYQLGGLIVKQAMVLANTEPEYYDIGLRTHKLVFVATPHHEADLATWENILDDMIMSSQYEIKGRKSDVLADLAVSINEVSGYFRGVLNYRVTDLPDHIEPYTRNTTIRSKPPLPSHHPDYASVSESVYTTHKGRITELDLRHFLFPGTLLTEYLWGTEQLNARLFYSDLLDFLRHISPSSYLIHRSTAWRTINDDFALDIYARHIASRQPLIRRYIQVIGPPEYGKATLVKVIAKRIMLLKKSAILFTIFLEPFQQADLDSRTLLLSFIHQIISQRPMLFSQIWLLYLQYRKLDVTTALDALWNIFTILLRASHDWKIVIAVTNLQVGSRAIQPFLKQLEALLKSLGSDYLLVFSSPKELLDRSLYGSVIVVDLGKDDAHRTSAIKSIVKNVLLALPGSQRLTPPEDYLNPEFSEIVSIAHAERYAALLSRQFLLSTPQAVDDALRTSPRTDEAIFQHCVQALDGGLLSWCNTMISWVHKAARPLRTKELAVAVALTSKFADVSRLIPQISEKLEADIGQHLDLILRVDHDLVYFQAANTRKYLNENESIPQKASDLKLLTHSQIVCLCLRYITAVVSQVPDSDYNAQVEWRGQLIGSHQQQTELEFLDYAVQHWPTHYLAYDQLNPNLEPQDINREGSSSPAPASNTEDSTHNQVLTFLSNDLSILAGNHIDDVGAVEVATELGLLPVVNTYLSATSEPTSAIRLDLENLLCIAVRHDHSEIVEALKKKGAKKDAAFLEAAGCGRKEYLERLSDDSLFQNSNEHLLESAIHKAARAGNLASVKFCNKNKINWDWKEEGSSVLHAAAIGGNVEILKYITDKITLGLDSKDKIGRTPLMIATELNHAQFVQTLCELGADTTLADNTGRTALHLAIIKNPDIASLLLQYGASPTIQDDQKQTPLHHACRLGDTGIVIQLVKAPKMGGSVDVRDDNGNTPLSIAAACGNRTLVSFLLDRGASASTEDGDGETPINIAAARGHLDVFTELYSRSSPTSSTREALFDKSVSMGQLLIVRFLLQEVSSLNFHVKLRSPLGVAAGEGHIEIVRLLLQNKADPNFLDGDGRSPLFRAVESGHADIARLLLKFESDPNALFEGRRTPLLFAASEGMSEVVEILLAGKADVNARDIVKNTALHLAVAYPDVVRVLLQYGPEPAPLNYAGETPLHLAIKGKHDRTVDLIIEVDHDLAHIANEKGFTPVHYSIENSSGDTRILESLCLKGGLEFGHPCYRENPPIFHALKHNNLAAVRFLLAKRPDLAVARNSDDSSTLHMAAETGHAEIIDLLFEASDNVDVNCRTKDDETPLHRAMLSPDEAVVGKLLEHNADMNAINSDGETALFRAAWRGRTNIVKCLLNAGADPNIRNNSAMAPLHAGADRAPVLEELLSRGAEIDHVHDAGRSALMLAVYWESEEGIKVLLRWKANVDIVDSSGETALHLAVREHNPVLSELLLEAGANPAAVNKDGMTPLHQAMLCRQGESRVAKINHLLEHGATANARDNDGNTPLHLVAGLDFGFDLVIMMMTEVYLQNNLSIDEKNNDEQTPLYRALAFGSYYATSLFLENGAKLAEQEKPLYLERAATGPESKKKVECLLRLGPWTLDDKVGAFLAASKTDLDTALIIAKDDIQIFQLDNDTFTVLTQCLNDGYYDKAIEFLRLGANPFLYQPGKLSAFQLAYSREKAPSFFDACLGKLDEDNADQQGLFQALKLGFEKYRSDLSRNSDRWNAKFTEHTIADQDGWTINDFTRLNFQDASNDDLLAKNGSSTACKRPTSLIVPDYWDLSTQLQGTDTLLFKDDKVYFYGDITETSVRADHPFLPLRSIRKENYFEIQILPSDKQIDDEPPIVGIGLCGEFVDLGNGFPGWEYMNPSTGYHGDNGCIYDSEMGDSLQVRTGMLYAVGDTVGCGIDWEQQCVYYTWNGERVGECLSEHYPDNIHLAHSDIFHGNRDNNKLHNTPEVLSCRDHVEEFLHIEGELRRGEFQVLSVGFRIASSVFAQRSGATRNLSLWPSSLWPSQSKPPTPQATETTEVLSEFSAPTPVESEFPVTEPPPPEATSNAGDLSQLPEDLLREFDPHSFLDIPERIGYLKELGLDYGYGPTSACQWFLENIHVYTGMPWWGTIATAAILFRVAMFYPVLIGSKHQARLQKVQANPAYIKAKAEFDEATFRTGDRAASMYARSEMRRLTKESGVSTLKPLVSVALLPFSFGMFRLIRGMADIPVPGMETGGLAWFSDLTVHDPLFILPSIGVALGVIMFKQSQRVAMNPSPAQEAIMKSMMWILPPLMFLGTAWQPAGLQWFFIIISLGSIAQAQATIMPSIRRWAALPPLPNRNTTVRGPAGVIQYQKPTGLRDQVKNSMEAVAKTAKDVTGNTDEKARWKKAQEYEDQRAEEDRQRAFRRMEEIRRRRAERHQ
ncbi:hypothetical protein GQX73_g7397 [Xylaria multiplex]|uniref:Uncharacterized protein n=1 Tax=Xylaria multiplex TaxID=323545 RepID=A0A7C8MRF5_9PEZI|nr:hypothetical protein GQX73_g7397 [Xylaria multiplex]